MSQNNNVVDVNDVWAGFDSTSLVGTVRKDEYKAERLVSSSFTTKKKQRIAAKRRRMDSTIMPGDSFIQRAIYKILVGLK